MEPPMTPPPMTMTSAVVMSPRRGAPPPFRCLPPGVAPAKPALEQARGRSMRLWRLTQGLSFGRKGRQAVDQGVVNHADEGDDIEHWKTRGPLDVGAVRRHVGALEHDRAHLRMLADQPASHPHVLFPRGLDVEGQEVVQEDPCAL